MCEGDMVKDFIGPLGQSCDFVNEDLAQLREKRYVFIAGGVGAAPVYPQVKWLHERGIGAEVILGARTKDLIILQDELGAVAQNLYVTTDDGTSGFHGKVTDRLSALADQEGICYDHAVVIGPMIMMKFACLLTKALSIPTTASMNPLMVDGTGMCGACRVTVGGEVKFACVDGPEFDGHLVDFDEAMRRQSIYKSEEGRLLMAMETSDHGEGCGCGGEDHGR
jgi:ferredoxin--NADP+ reductase